MIETIGDLWTHEPADARVITTNGDVAAIGTTRQHAVMGRGVALDAAKRWPGLSSYFGTLIRENGNVPQVLMRTGDRVPPSTGPIDAVLVSMPVKDHWHQPARLKLIELSAQLLMRLADREGWQHVVMPRPGCGNGGLDWVAQVRPLLVDILDDRFCVVFPE